MTWLTGIAVTLAVTVYVLLAIGAPNHVIGMVGYLGTPPIFLLAGHSIWSDMRRYR